MRRLSREQWTLVGLVVVAILARAARLHESLWYDEITAWAAFGQHGPRAIVSSLTDPANHIAHTLATWCSVEALEPALGFELALRLPAFLFSVGAVVAMHGLARQVLSPLGAITAAALMAILPVAVLEGAEARGYSMMIFFSALASRQFLANLGRRSAGPWLLYAGLCALGAWSHMVSAFVPIGHAAWLAGRALRSRDLRAATGPALGIAFAGALTVALYAPALADLMRGRALYFSSRGNEPGVFGPEGWHTLLELGGSWYLGAALPGLALLAVGIGRAVARRGADARLRTALAVTLAGLPIFILAVWLGGSWMYARFALFALPGAVLAMAAAIETILAWNAATALAASIAVLGASAGDLALRPPKQPLRDAAAWVRAGYAEGEAILVVGIAFPVMDLYLGDLSPAHSAFHGTDLSRQLEARPAWVILYYPRHVSRDNYALLEARGYGIVHRFPGWVDWDNGDVLVYRLVENP